MSSTDMFSPDMRYMSDMSVHVRDKQVVAKHEQRGEIGPTTPFGVLASVFFDRHSVKGPGVDA